MIQVTFSIFIHLFLIIFCVFFVKKVLLSCFFEKSNCERLLIRNIITDNNIIMERIKFSEEQEKSYISSVRKDLIISIENSLYSENLFLQKENKKNIYNNFCRKKEAILYGSRAAIFLHSRIKDIVR
jgi:hypothetical protein